MSGIPNTSLVILGDVSQICRFCLETNTAVQPLEESPLLEHFRKFSNLELKLDSVLPKSICEQCMELLIQVKNVTSFVDRCKHSQQILGLFNRNKIGKECMVYVQVQGDKRQVLPSPPVIVRTFDNNTARAHPSSNVVYVHNYAKNSAENPLETALNTTQNDPLNSTKNEVIVVKENPLETVYNAAENDPLNCTENIETEVVVESTSAENDPLEIATNTAENDPLADEVKIETVDHPVVAETATKNKEKCPDCGDMVISLYYHKLSKYCRADCKLSCKHCDFTTTEVNLLYQHAVETHISTSTNAPKPGAPTKKPKEKEPKLYVCKMCMRLYTSWKLHKTQSPDCAQEKRAEMCDECGKIVANLRQHKQSQICRLNCAQCDFKATDRTALAAHFRTAHPRKKVCAVCNETVDDMLKHRKESPSCRPQSRPQSAPQMCEQCGTLVRNVTLHRNTKCTSTVCTVCKFQAETPVALRAHYGATHARVVTSQCGKCGKNVVDMRRHRRENVTCRFKCTHPGCTYTGVSKCVVAKHAEAHSDVCRFVCEECGAKFKYVGNYRRHKKVHELGKRFQCDQCPKNFSTKGKLQCHLNVHYGLKPFKCAYCDKTFGDYDVRNVHVYKAHPDKYVRKKRVNYESTRFKRRVRDSTGAVVVKNADEKTFTCPECKETFSTYQLCYLHKLRHKPAPYACTLCNFKTYTGTTLKQHMYRHTGEKPYQCDQCPKQFRQATPFQRHLLTHANRKEHVCEHCGKSFNVKWSLDEHLRRHDGIKVVYKCPACPREFCDSRGRFRHIQRVHKDGVDLTNLQGRLYVNTKEDGSA